MQGAAPSAAPVAGPGAPPPPPRGPAPVITGLQTPLQPEAVASVRLVVLRGSVAEGAAYDVPHGVTSIGRAGDLAFPDDNLLAPKHILLQRVGAWVDLIEASGPGGCFRRTRETTPIASGDIVFAGEQYLLVRSGDDVPFAAPVGPDLPPETFGTPLPPPKLHVTQLLAGGTPGRVVSTDREVITVGREGCDLSFPQDRFMSGRHLRIEVTSSGGLQIVDSGSLNGTFVRAVKLPQRLQKADELLVGAMLFRLDIKSE